MKTDEIKELRIDNWLIDGYGEYSQVKGTRTYGVLLTHGEYLDGGRDFDISQLKFIPLTEDLLIKAGFHLDTTDDIYIIQLEDSEFVEKRLEIAFIDTELIGNNIHISAIQELKIGDQEPTGIKLSEIKYLHQLQNLFYDLTYNELPIQL